METCSARFYQGGHHAGARQADPPPWASGDRATLGHSQANTALGRLCSSGAQVKQPCFFNFASVLEGDICYSTCCNSQAMVGNRNFIFDIQINSNSLRRYPYDQGKALFQKGVVH